MIMNTQNMDKQALYALKNDIDRDLDKIYNAAYDSVGYIHSKIDHSSTTKSVYGYKISLNEGLLDISSLKNQVHKSLFISALVSDANYSVVVNLLKGLSTKLALLFNNRSTIMAVPGCHANLLQYPTKPWKLVSLFLTNNIEPQVVFFGEPFANLEESDSFRKPIFFWKMEDAVKTYESQLVNLDSNISMSQLLTKIDVIYTRAIANIKKDPESYMTNHDAIIYYDLVEIMSDVQYYNGDALNSNDYLQSILQQLVKKSVKTKNQ